METKLLVSKIHTVQSKSQGRYNNEFEREWNAHFEQTKTSRGMFRSISIEFVKKNKIMSFNEEFMHLSCFGFFYLMSIQF